MRQLYHIHKFKFYYLWRAIFHPYRGIYRGGFILPWIPGVINFQVFSNISETRLPTNMYYTSLERLFYSASARLCCIKIQAEMTEILQVKD